MKKALKIFGITVASFIGLIVLLSIVMTSTYRKSEAKVETLEQKEERIMKEKAKAYASNVSSAKYVAKKAMKFPKTAEVHKVTPTAPKRGGESALLVVLSGENSFGGRSYAMVVVEFTAALQDRDAVVLHYYIQE